MAVIKKITDENRQGEKIISKKKDAKEKEPQYYGGGVDLVIRNYHVYYLSPKEKIMYGVLAFLIGAVAGYIFYGGIGSDEYGDPTKITLILNTVVMVGVGALAAIIYLPVKQKQLLKAAQVRLRHQFRDMLEAFATSLGSGKNVPDAFEEAEKDLKNQYESGAYILNELTIINSGIRNGMNVEELLSDFGHRSAVEDVESFADVFSICYRRGGNIQETVRNTCEVISDKINVTEDIETTVTAAKAELKLMLILPAVLLVLMKASGPDFAGKFTTSTGLLSTTVALVFVVAAYFIGQKILDINV